MKSQHLYSHQTPMRQGAGLTQSVEHTTLHLGVVSLSPMLV